MRRQFRPVQGTQSATSRRPGNPSNRFRLARPIVTSVVGIAVSVALFSTPAALAQTKPTPVKVAAAEASDTSPNATRVAAGVDPDAAKAPDTTIKQRVATKTKTKAVKVRMAAASFPSASDILSNSRILLSDNARTDVKAGVVDPRVLGALAALAKRNIIEVQCLKSGHSRYVAGSNRESNHYYGRGADISKVDGVAVSRSNQAAFALANYVLTLPGELRPDELGSPWSGDGSDAAVQVFTDEGHDDHLHLGFDE